MARPRWSRGDLDGLDICGTNSWHLEAFDLVNHGRHASAVSGIDRDRRGTPVHSVHRSMRLKSTEVYALLREALRSWFRAAGFKRDKGSLSWCRMHEGAHTVVWFQVSQDEWDDFAGSKFVVEFQRSTESFPGAHPSRRMRMAQLLPVAAREEMRVLQNSVIASLAQPPNSHYVLHISESVTQWYRKKFVRDARPYSERDDVWLRYATPDHVCAWSQFLLMHLPICVATVESWPAAECREKP
jgi:hypothetical protein